MKTATTALAILLATSAFAQEGTRPDYSRSTLLRLFVGTPDEPQPDVRFHAGAVEFRAMGTDWRFAYLPLLPSLSGAMMRTTQQWPDPFALTGTPLATPARLIRSRREISRELREIEIRGRAKVKVKVQGEQ